jgi:hypothetical protein
VAAGNFNEVQELLSDGSVDTKGPLDDNSELLEICVWVVQRTGEDKSGAGDANDAAATDMTEFEVLPGPPKEWHLPAKLIEGSKSLTEGPAVGMAIAMFKVADTKGPSTCRVQFWSQTIELRRAATSS